MGTQINKVNDYSQELFKFTCRNFSYVFYLFKQVIYRVQAMESRNDPLPVSMTGIRGKGPKR